MKLNLAHPVEGLRLCVRGRSASGQAGAGDSRMRKVFATENLDATTGSVAAPVYASPATDRESQTSWSIVGDSRVDALFRFLRVSIDELPQLWSIVRGEMALIGPRPERPHFVEEFISSIPGYQARHRVPVGLTGWAAVSGLSSDTSIIERARYDNFYITNWSLWFDVKIVLRTIWALVARFPQGRSQERAVQMGIGSAWRDRMWPVIRQRGTTARHRPGTESLCRAR
jgi:Bacterial sugar transferase